jgi:hypothetical protein
VFAVQQCLQVVRGKFRRAGKDNVQWIVFTGALVVNDQARWRWAFSSLERMRLRLSGEI